MFRIGFVAVAAIFLSSCDQTSGGLAPSPNTVVQRLGYDAVALPSTAYGPGSLVTSVKGSGLKSPLKLTYLCRPDFTNAPKPIVDVAASSEASRQFNGTFKLDATALAELGISAGLDNVESVTMKFNNVKIEQLGFEDLASIRAGLGPNCAEILREFSRKKSPTRQRRRYAPTLYTRQTSSEVLQLKPRASRSRLSRPHSEALFRATRRRRYKAAALLRPFADRYLTTAKPARRRRRAYGPASRRASHSGRCPGRHPDAPSLRSHA